MKAIIGRFAVIITLSLVFLFTSLLISPKSVLAWGTLSVPADGIVHHHGGAGIPPVTDSFTCETWNTNGIKCHWQAGRPADSPLNFEILNLNFNDTRGEYHQPYYIQIVSNTSGTFTSSFPDVIFQTDEPLRYPLATETNPAVGTGLTIINHTILDMFDQRIDFGYSAESGHGANSVDVTFYISPTPFVTEIPATVYLHSTIMPYESAWRSRLGAYFTEMNYFLLPTNKRISWDGTVHVSDTKPFSYGTQNCKYDEETSLKIWFTSSVPEDPSNVGESMGTDCDGSGAIIFYTSGLYLPDLPYTIPDIASIVNATQTPIGWANYWKVVHALLHEFIHTRGGYPVELYWFEQVFDNNTLEPKLNIDVTDKGDLWWDGNVYGGWYHPGFRTDPMRRIDSLGTKNTFEDTRLYIALSPLSKNFVNSDAYIGQRHTGTVWGEQAPYNDKMFPNFTNLDVYQYDGAETGNPVQGIYVKAWYLGVNSYPIENQIEITDNGPYITDVNGHVTIPWDSESLDHDPHQPIYNAVILKSYYDQAGTQPYGRAQIVDVFNLQQKVFATGGPITQYSVSMGKADAPGYVREVSVPAVFASSPLSPVMGWIRETAYNSNEGGTKVSNGPVRVGDDSSKRGIRSIIQFDTSYIPDDAIITGATLNLTNDGAGLGDITGFGPTSDPDSMAVQAGSPCIGSCFLQSADYEASLVTLGYYYAGNNPQPTLPPGEYLFNSNLTRISKTGVTDLRLRFNKVTDIDGYSDYFSAYGASSAQPPTFTVGYRMP